jgi:hypothetical protein
MTCVIPFGLGNICNKFSAMILSYITYHFSQLLHKQLDHIIHKPGDRPIKIKQIHISPIIDQINL